MPATPTTVASAASGSAGTLTITGAASGDLLLLLSRDAANEYFTGVTDSAGGTWTLLSASPTSGTVGRRVELWSKQNSGAITSVTATYAGTTGAHGCLISIAGSDNVGPYATTFQAASLTPTELKITTTSANMLLISMCQANTNTQAQHAAEVGWTKGTTSASGPAWAWRNDLASGVNDGCQWTLTSSVGSGQAIVAYDASAPVGPTVTYWNGTSEVPATLTYWDGATEVPITAISVT